MRSHGVLVLLAVLTASCTSAAPQPSTTTEASTPPTTVATTTSTTAAPTTTAAEPVSWTGLTLPRPVSALELIDGVVVYEGLDANNDLVVAGVDAASGELVYSLPAGVYDRFPGETSAITTLDGIVLRFAPVDGRPAVVAHNGATGAELWSLDLDGPPRPASTCGDAFCVTTAGTRYVIGTDGGVVDQVPTQSRRVLVSVDGLEISPVDEPFNYQPPVALVASDRSLTETWRIEGADVVEAIGHRVTADTGWSSWEPTDGVGALFLGLRLADGWAQGDPVGEEWLEVEGWGGVGFDVATGEIVWGVGEVWPVFSVDGLLLHSAGLDLELDEFVFDGLIRLDPVTGERAWSVDFDVSRSDDIDITEDAGVVRLEVTSEISWLDFDTGEPISPDDDFLHQCTVVDGQVTAKRAEGGTAEFNRADVLLPCETGGRVVSPVDIYGPAVDAPSNVTVADSGHWLWTDANGVLAGIGPG